MAYSVLGRLGCSILVLIIIALYGCGDAIVNTMEVEQGLIFSEVYLHNPDSETNWLEVCNASDQAMTLTFFRPSHISTPNILPREVLFEPDDVLIICADEDQFTTNWGDEFQLLEINELSWLIDGGFIVLGTGYLGDTGVDGFNYGNTLITEEQAEWFGEQALDFLTDGKSWSRYIVKTPDKVEVTAYIQTTPTPGTIISY
ncbi:hypothetical protein ACFL6I_01265 [candidate division KSB1 bacterium]